MNAHLPFSPQKQSIFGKSYHTDWSVLVIFFFATFVILCVAAGTGYYWMVTSAFPQNLTVKPSDTTTFTRDRNIIQQAQTYLEGKAQQFAQEQGGVFESTSTMFTTTITSTTTSTTTSVTATSAPRVTN